MAIGGFNITNFNQAALDQQRAIQECILAKAVQNGSLSREEFLDLNNDRNADAQLRDSFAKSDGISPEEQQILDARQLAYGHKLDQYRDGDFKPALPGGTPYERAQTEQGGKIFDGIREGTINSEESLSLLLQQRQIAAGSQQRDPVSQQRLLDESEFEIKLARKAANPATPPLPPPSFFKPPVVLGKSLGFF